MIKSEQIRAGRALLNWSQDKLSKKSGFSLPAINNIERGIVQPRAETLNVLRQTLEKEGVEFTEGSGVRLRSKILNIKMMEGREGLIYLYQDIFNTLKDNGGGVALFSGIDERPFEKIAADILSEYIVNVRKFGKIKNKLLFCEGDTFFLDAFDISEWRWVPSEFFHPVPMYIYGDKHAILLWEKPVQIVMIHNAAIAETYRKQFLAHWKTAKKPVISSKNIKRF